VARLDLTRPLTPDQALLHIATGNTRFVKGVRGKSQLGMAREWLSSGDDLHLPSNAPADRKRLVELRGAMSRALGDLDELELPGWAWVWLAKDRAPDSIHPTCETNWREFVTERSSVGSPATLALPGKVAAKEGMDSAHELRSLVDEPFDFGMAIKLAKWGEVSPKAERPAAQWRSTGLEPDVQRALAALARTRPQLLWHTREGKPYRSDTLDRFDLYVALCRVHPVLLATRYSATTILKCLTTLVACKRGRRPSAHPYVAPQPEGLGTYANEALCDDDWLRYFGFRSR